MEPRQVIGTINERGELEIEAVIDLPPGSVRVTIEPLTEEEDEALWDAQFAASQDVLEKLADQALAEWDAGEVEDWDPDNDPDLP